MGWGGDGRLWRRMRRLRLWAGLGLGLVVGCLSALGMERVSLNTGFSVDCSRRVVVGDRVRLYPVDLAAGFVVGEDNYVEVSAGAVVSVEILPDPPRSARPVGLIAVSGGGGSATPTAAEMQGMLARAGGKHHVDADLLGSVVRAESGGRVRAVSRTGAQGLMQLMPGTATQLGVGDAFQPEQNINGGTAYLDWLLVRYHDDLVKAVAAYNAGPRAVDRYHGVPPYRETRAYVARVVREFNRRKLAAMAAVVVAPAPR